MRSLLILYLLFQSVLVWSQDTQFLSEEEKSKEAIRTTRMLFKSINRAIQMGRDQKPMSEANEEIDRIMNQFEQGATMEVSKWENGQEIINKIEMRRYLKNLYNKAKDKVFKIEFDDPQVDVISKDSYLVRMKFWQKYASKTYEDRTSKGVVIRFIPLGNNYYEVKIVRVYVLETKPGKSTQAKPTKTFPKKGH